MLRRRIAELADDEKGPNGLAIAFPDDGAAKRFKTRFPEFEHIICIKVPHYLSLLTCIEVCPRCAKRARHLRGMVTQRSHGAMARCASATSGV